MSEREIKPCPFCGGEATLGGFVASYYVCCSTDECWASIHGSLWIDADEAIATWNRRHPSTAEKERDRLMEALAEAIEETLWDAYNIGFEANGKWMDGARSEGEWLQRELGLEDGGHHDAAMIRERTPALAREIAARSALSPTTDPTT